MIKLIIMLLACALGPSLAAAGFPAFGAVICLVIVGWAAYQSQQPATTISSEVRHDHRFDPLEIQHHHAVAVNMNMRDGFKPQKFEPKEFQ